MKDVWTKGRRIRRSCISLMLTGLLLSCTSQPTEQPSEVSVSEAQADTLQQPLLQQNEQQDEQQQDEQQQDEQQQAEETSSSLISSEPAQITDVQVSGDAGNYSFAVTVSSPDTGCDAYANWWEVISPEGTLLYRRVLAHSHVDEQPFTRSGGPIPVAADQPIIVRVHMYPSGYSPHAMSGTVDESLVPETLSAKFAANLAEADPQPKGCGF